MYYSQIVDYYKLVPLFGKYKYKQLSDELELKYHTWSEMESRKTIMKHELC